MALLAGASVVVKAQTVEELTQRSGRTVRRVNCSQLRSKYIGETEKNLSALFDEAERNDWILFFDEADALFGKRTGVKDSHDRYANQEVAYLLKRMETFNGLTVFATNDEQDLPRKLLVRASSSSLARTKKEKSEPNRRGRTSGVGPSADQAPKLNYKWGFD